MHEHFERYPHWEVFGHIILVERDRDHSRRAEFLNNHGNFFSRPSYDISLYSGDGHKSASLFSRKTRADDSNLFPWHYLARYCIDVKARMGRKAALLELMDGRRVRRLLRPVVGSNPLPTEARPRAVNDNCREKPPSVSNEKRRFAPAEGDQTALIVNDHYGAISRLERSLDRVGHVECRAVGERRCDKNWHRETG